MVVVKNSSKKSRGIFVGPGTEPISENQIIQKFNDEASIFIKMNGIIFNFDTSILV